MLNMFDDDSSDGLSGAGVIALILVLGFGAYFLWQQAYTRGAKSVLNLAAPGCTITAHDGKRLMASDVTLRDKTVIPKGATVSAECLNTL